MKNLITIINLAIIVGITTIFTQSDKMETRNDRKQVASITQPEKTIKSGFSTRVKNDASLDDVSEASTFLQEITEARLMDLEEGQTAAQRSTTRPLKDYGLLMVEDQTKMLKDLKDIAEKKHIEIPTAIGDDKTEGLEDLRKVHGKAFDKKFVKMMIIDHKRDLRKLERAIRSKDADIQVFATKYLPVVQTHLDKVKALKKTL